METTKNISNKAKNTILMISKIFLIGLLLQFFVQTFVTYKLWFDGSIWNIIWAWKEILIIWLMSFTAYRLWTSKIWKSIFDKLWIKWFVLSVIWLAIFVILVNLLIVNTSWAAIIYSLKYSIIWFMIFILFALISWRFFDEHTDLEKRYSKIIKRLLIGSIFWWLIIYFIPRLLEFVGYNQYNYEWKIWIAPPSVYYSQYNTGYARNQFLFERPISRGFFLVALWPLFFAIAIKHRWRKKVLIWGGLYSLAILSTFSRAARAAWLLQTAVLILIEYRKNLKYILLYWWVPVLLLFWTVTYLWRDQIINRQFSNTGHIRMIQEAINKIIEKPRFWQWASSAWPASYQLTDGKKYNPENQFLQIWIEYWIFGFIAWMLLYWWLHVVWFKALIKSKNHNVSKQTKYIWFILFCLSLWLAWLSICWLVLHSFVDRMIVYPIMALFWVVYALYKKQTSGC